VNHSATYPQILSKRPVIFDFKTHTSYKVIETRTVVFRLKKMTTLEDTAGGQTTLGGGVGISVVTSILVGGNE
jgi:hypothetical protein